MAPDPYKLGEVVSEYRVEVVDLLRRERIIVTVNSSSTSIQLDFLKPFTSYEFKLYSSTSSWEGNITDTISLKTEEDGKSRWVEGRKNEVSSFNYLNAANSVLVYFAKSITHFTT